MVKYAWLLTTRTGGGAGCSLFGNKADFVFAGRKRLM
jgi:hypothetical protein